MRFLTLEEILRLHFQVIEDYGGLHGVRDEGRLASLVIAPQQKVFGVEQYPGIFSKTALYTRNLIADHSFLDGNKRTAVTAAGIFLSRNGYRLTATAKELEEFAVHIAVHKPEISQIAKWFKQHSSK